MKNKTILCIEDDRFIGEMYTTSLKRAGYTVDWATSGDEGLATARNKHYDVILLDIMLPELEGSKILEILKGGKENLIPNTKVIILTNYEQDDDAKMALQKYADGYLIKAEITPHRLIEIINNMVG